LTSIFNWSICDVLIFYYSLLLWKHPSKAWIGNDHPCDKADMDFFDATTTIPIRDGRTASFWHVPWLHGRKPKDIVSSIFAISKRKNFTVSKGMHHEFWITKLKTNEVSTTAQLVEFVELWSKVNEMHLTDGIADDNTGKFTNFGVYTAASSYKAQFEGTINSFMLETVWKNWAPPKCKLFAWLILQNRASMADLLQKRGWPNCGNCQLCKRESETAAHLLFKCHYFWRIWNSIISWLGLTSVDVSSWSNLDSVKELWLSFIYPNGARRKSFVLLIMLTSWEIWNEH
jgi:hypothetical protein